MVSEAIAFLQTMLRVSAHLLDCLHSCKLRQACMYSMLLMLQDSHAADSQGKKSGSIKKPVAQHSGRWKIQPKVSATQIYSDNIRLASSKSGKGPDAAFLSAITPNIVIQHDGKSRFLLNYSAQGLFYNGTDIGNRLNQRMQMTSHTPLLENSLFLDSTSTMGQYNVSSGARTALDNFSATNGIRNFRTLRLSPYWTPHFGGYADGLVQITYTQNSAGSGLGSDSFGQTVYLGNQKQQDTVTWRANIFNQTIHRDTTRLQSGQGQDVRYRNYNAEIGTRLNEHVRPFLRAGYFDNNPGTSSQVSRVRNGSYWTAGVEWKPSRKLTMQAEYGINNYSLGLRWNPDTRTCLQIMYRDSEVGGAYGNTGSLGTANVGSGLGGGSYPSGTGNTIGSSFGGSTGLGSGGCSSGGLAGPQIPTLTGNIGGFGSTGLGGGLGVSSAGFGGSGFGGGGLSSGFGGAGFGSGGFGQLGAFNAGSNWNALLRHKTRRTTWYATYGTSITTIEQILLDASTSSQYGNYLSLDQPRLTSEIITRQRGQIGFQFASAKTSVSLSGYREDRSYSSSGDQNVLGASAYWNWNFTHTMTSLMSLGWQSTDSSSLPGAVETTRNELKMVSLGLSRRIWEELNGYLEFRHLEQDSNNDNFQYRENRISASVFMGF